MHSLGIVDTVSQDVRYAARLLRKHPGFTSIAVVSLALGIGVNTAMFSVVHAVLLRPLPYPQPSRLVRISQVGSLGDAITMAEFEFVREHSGMLSSVAGSRGGGERRLGARDSQEWIRTAIVTADYLRTLDIRPALGREFTPDEARAGGPQAIILSDALWRRAFGADPHVLGRAVALEDTTVTIVGVLPEDAWFPQPVDALLPLRPTGSLGDLGTNTLVVARLQDGVSIQQAQAELAAVSERFRQAQPGSASRSTASRSYRGLTAMPYHQALVGDVRMNLWLLFGATGLLLLIACSNLATLLLTRFAARGKEVALRLALGSSRGRLLRQFFIENLLIAGLGAIAGVGAAHGLLQGLVAWMPFNLPASAPVRLNGAVLAFAVAVATIAALAFTLMPLLTARRLNVHQSLKGTGRTAGTDTVRARTRNLLVIAEVSVSTTLLIAACLLMQSLYRIQQERLGFVPDGLITFETPFAPERRQSPADRAAFTDALLERLQAVPGVRGAAAANVLPLTSQSNVPTQRDGHPDQSIGGMEVRAVTPAYFELMGIPVKQGRTFTTDDRASSVPVAVVNDTVASRWWPQTREAIGDRVVIGRFQGRDFGKTTPREVIGVVADTKTMTLTAPPRPTVFVPLPQGEGASAASLSWIVRTNGSERIGDQLRRAVAEVDPGQRVRRLRPMTEIVSATTAGSRFNAWLFGIFAGAAILLAAIGLYGLLSFLVVQRRQEIGTRIALGARHADVLTVFLKQGLVLTATGLIVGLAGAFALTRGVSNLLFGVRPNDPVSFVAVSVLLLVVGLAASYVPARRAARVDPMEAFRAE